MTLYPMVISTFDSQSKTHWGRSYNERLHETKCRRLLKSRVTWVHLDAPKVTCKLCQRRKPA